VDLICRDEFRGEVEKSTTPFSVQDLERLREDFEDLTRYSEKYLQERDALVNELVDVMADLISYGHPHDRAG
jgi:hypothetical protein